MRAMLGAALALAALPAIAQIPAPPAPAGRLGVSAAEIDALVARARQEIKPGSAIFSAPLLRLSPYAANLEYRRGPVAPAIHVTDAEIFYVLRGSGTFVVGGTLADPVPNGANIIGRAVVGGASRAVRVGDYFIIPENTPHGFPQVDGELVMISLHVPRPVPATPPR